MHFDTASVHRTNLAIELANAALRDEHSERFPWVDQYPLVGQTVLAYDEDGELKLWHTAGKEHGIGSCETIGFVKLVGCGHDAELTTTLGSCRPVTWTAEREELLG